MDLSFASSAAATLMTSDEGTRMFFIRACELGTAFLGTFSAVGKSTSTAGANTGNASTKWVNVSCYEYR